MNELENCYISSRIGAEMHTDTVSKWVYLNGTNESQIKAEVKYKIWLNVTEKTDPNQPQPYTCEVHWVEEVPKQIIEAEELARNYWATKEPKKGTKWNSF